VPVGDAWPGGARCALALTFDFDAEEVWLADQPGAADRPSLLSQGTYGGKVAVPLILDVLGRRGVTGTFFVVGRVAERYPDRVRDIVAAGHELAHHGYTHNSPAGMSAEDEEDELVRAREVLESFGPRVVGYRSPSWEFSASTLELLSKHGFEYSSNFMDDLRPYVHPDTSVVELPIQWLLDDAAHFWFSGADWTKKISTTAEVRSIWEEELVGIRELRGCFVLTMHPQVIGRPSRLRLLDDFIGFAQSLGDVWITTCADIAAHVGAATV
jgi:peptidoglycan/xylan/chitin deacetylase (PgdA/CDA1 family)